MTTERVQIRVRCPADKILQVQADLASHVGDCQLSGATIVERIPPSLLDREPLRQVEFVDVIVGLIVNIASNAAYDAIKARVASFRREAVQVEVVDPERQPDHRSDTRHSAQEKE
jgi:hypothetical protein